MMLCNYKKFRKWCDKNALDANEILTGSERYMLGEKCYGNPNYVIKVSQNDELGRQLLFRFVIEKPMLMCEDAYQPVENMKPQIIRLPLYRFEVCK